MKNKVTIILLLIFVITVFSAALAGDMKKYENREYGFSMDFPADWEIKEGEMGIAVMAVSPLEDSGDQFRENINVVVNDIPPDLTLEQYVEDQVDECAKNLEKFTIQQRGKAFINDHPCIWMSCSHIIQGHTLRILVYYYVRDSKGYVITASSMLGKYSEYYPVFNKINKSFKFIEK